MLTFSEIKSKCVPGESVLVSDQDRERVYVGFTGENMIVTERFGDMAKWDENDIKNWSIKPKTKKIVKEFWININPEWGPTIHNSEGRAKTNANKRTLETFHFRKEYEVPE